jgi:hypothetical protein
MAGMPAVLILKGRVALATGNRAGRLSEYTV